MIPKQTQCDFGNAYFDFKYHLSMGYNNKVLKLRLAPINRIGKKMNLILRVCAFILKLTLPNIKPAEPEGAFVAHTLRYKL